MWYVILGIVIISAGAGLIYLSGRVARFGVIRGAEVRSGQRGNFHRMPENSRICINIVNFCRT